MAEIAYINGSFMPKNEIRISPDDRGFLFADGIYEVVKWYGGDFFDMDSHIARLKRSLRETRIDWGTPGDFQTIAGELISLNNLGGRQAMVYLQVTRGEARRSHSFPSPPVSPTVYAFARELPGTGTISVEGIKVMLTRDIRWSRCDIKSVALLPNVLGNQEAAENGFRECIFSRDGLITEASHSNIFFVSGGMLFTHPESEFILSGITRKKVIALAVEAGIKVTEKALPEKSLEFIDEAFITNTTGEITPVIAVGDITIGNGTTGSVTRLLINKFMDAIAMLSAGK
jgi:D-alanine transaminase